jgi:hypothetical protein
MENTTFADGMIFKTSDNQPDFVVGKLSVKVDDFIKFLKSNEKKGWVNLDILKGKSGKPYVKLNTYEAKTANTDEPKNNTAKPITEEINKEDELPF